jgi:hypothetical protein
MLLKLKMPSDIIPKRNQTTDSSGRPCFPGYYYLPTPIVNRLVLQGDRLLVIINGSPHQIGSRVSPILTDYLSTHVRLYKIVDKSAGVLKLVSTSDLTGHFTDVRTIDGKAHVVTTSSVDTCTDLEAPFDLQETCRGDCHS